MSGQYLNRTRGQGAMRLSCVSKLVNYTQITIDNGQCMCHIMHAITNQYIYTPSNGSVLRGK